MMNKYVNTTTIARKAIIAMVIMLACAAIFAAMPAHTAGAAVTQISIRDLNASLLGEDVPAPRMFTQGFDFLNFVGSVSGDWYKYTDVNGYEVFYNLSTGTFHSSVGGEEITILFPSDGMQYTFDGSDPHAGIELRERGPHGGYTTTSAKCAVCHSAHSATIPGDVNPETGRFLVSQGNTSITRSGSASCEFCHLTGTTIGAAGMRSNVVFTGGEGGVSYVGSDSSAEDFSGHRLFIPGVAIPGSEMVNSPSEQVVLDNGLSCSTCHAVHGNVSTWQPPDFYRGEVTDPISGMSFTLAGLFGNSETVDLYSYSLLRNSPAGVANPGIGEVTFVGEPSTDYATSTDQYNQFMMNLWCANCHNADSMNKTMEGMRVSQAGDDFDSLVTTFTATGDFGDVHNEDGGFAAGYGSSPQVPNEPHSTAFVGVYSGPGQRYTCHRGDLGGPLTAEWETHPSGAREDIIPIPDEENPPLVDEENPTLVREGSLSRFRALGYFSLEPGSESEQLAQQARNLACGSCHFGTADYARWSRQSDWPHRSGENDRSLLGIDRDITAGANPGFTPQNFCGRCHVPVDLDGTPDGFVISHHFITHRAPDPDGSSGETGHDQSPGPPPSNENTSTSNEPTASQ